jgi:hypothetical protein
MPGPPAVHLHARPGRRPTTPPALATVQSLALLTAMFTVGHSVSLALAALGWVTLPSRCVKTGIAITIALGAERDCLHRRSHSCDSLVDALFVGRWTGTRKVF